MTKTSVSSALTVFNAAWTELHVFTFGYSFAEEVITMLSRLGNAPFGSDSNVRRPIITVCPDVRALNLFKSAGKWHNKPLFLPIARFSATAAMIEMVGI